MSEPFEWLIVSGRTVHAKFISRLSQKEKNELEFLWDHAARAEQLPPPGGWRIWMITGGRRFGKTRAGAEWVRMIADGEPGARVALVSSSLAKVRAVMVGGESGIMAIYPPEQRPCYEPSAHRTCFRNVAQARQFSAAGPESLRGPQRSHAFRTGGKRVLS